MLKALSGTEALIDLGLKQGVNRGDRFALLAQGPDLVHPVTGRMVQGERKVLGQLVVTAVGEESATVRTAGDPLPWRPGLLVERQVP